MATNTGVRSIYNSNKAQHSDARQSEVKLIYHNLVIKKFVLLGMSDQENLQTSNMFPSALKKNRRRNTIFYKVSILEKLGSKTVLEIIKGTDIPENTIRDWVAAEENLRTTTKNKKKKCLDGQGRIEKIFFNHVCTVYCKYCMF